MGSQLEGDRPSWWQRLYNRQERFEGMNKKLEGHTREAKNEQEVGPGYKAPKPTHPTPVTHFLQQDPTSQRFHRSLRQ